jgi:hypothetical protein
MKKYSHSSLLLFPRKREPLKNNDLRSPLSRGMHPCFDFFFRPARPNPMQHHFDSFADVR